MQEKKNETKKEKFARTPTQLHTNTHTAKVFLCTPIQLWKNSYCQLWIIVLCRIVPAAAATLRHKYVYILLYIEIYVHNFICMHIYKSI